MNDLRDGNTRKSLKRVSNPPEPPNRPIATPLELPNRPLPLLPERPSSPGRPLPLPQSQQEPRASPTTMMGSESRSPLQSELLALHQVALVQRNAHLITPLISRHPLLLKRGRFHIVKYPNQCSFERAVTPP